MNPSDTPSPSGSTEFSTHSAASTAPFSTAPSSDPELMPFEDVALNETSNPHLSGDERTRLSLLAETVGFQKTWRSGGYVTISRRTVEEEVQIPVTLRHEEITMTRHFRDPNAPENAPEAVTLSSEFGEGYGEGTVVMRLHEETAEVIKTVRVAEEVEFARRLVSEETRLTGTARREELDIKAPQNVHVSEPEFPIS